MKNGYDEDEAAQRGFRETWLKEFSNIELGQGATLGVITNTNFQHIGFATRRYHETCDRPYFRPMNQSSCQEVPLHNHDLSDHPILCRSFALFHPLTRMHISTPLNQVICNENGVTVGDIVEKLKVK